MSEPQNTLELTGAIRSSNSAVFGLGPLGSWRIGIEGNWKNTGDGKTVWVAFDRFRCASKEGGDGGGAEEGVATEMPLSGCIGDGAGSVY